LLDSLLLENKMFLRCLSSLTLNTSLHSIKNISAPVGSAAVLFISVRNMGMRSKYGSEDGHDLKNEVRKEKWINKRRRQSLGGDYREFMDLSRNIHSPGEYLVDGQDWSYADGRPGVPAVKQIKRMYATRIHAIEIKAAMDLVNSYKQSNVKSEEDKAMHLKTKQMLKYKGDRTL